MLLLLLSSALALPPDGMAALLPVGSGLLESMGTSYDGDVVYGVAVGSGQAFVLHVEDWSVLLVDQCVARSATWIGYDDGLDDEFGELWVGCEDGLVRGLEWDPVQGTLSPFLHDDGSEYVLDFGAPVEGLWFSTQTEALYGIDTSGSTPVLHRGDPFLGTVDGDAFPLSLGAHTGFNEGVLLYDDLTLMVHHGGRNMTTVDLASGAALPSTAFGVSFSPTDIHPSWNGGVYGVSDQDNLAEYVAPLWTVHLTGLDQPNAVVASLDVDDPWIAVTGGDVRVWELDPDTGAIVGSADQPYFQSLPEDVGQEQNYIQDGVTSDGYLWGGGTSGNLHVVTARPWVDPDAVVLNPSTATDGDVVSVSFSLDEALDWELRLGGDRHGGGKLIASGTAVAGETVEASVTVDTTWAEGNNPVYVIVTDGRNLTGHARGVIFVDNPPKPPTLLKPDLEFADRALELSFDGIPDADLAQYEVYVSTTPFDPADWPEGGPVFDGGTRLVNPVVVTGEPGARVNVELRPLKNDVKHYVAVRAVDQGGLVGPMSNVISGTPRPAYSASELAGETGGPRCATTPGAAGWLGIGLSALVALRRRRSAVALLGAMSLVPVAARAQEDGERKGPQRDMTKQTGDFELRYGGIALRDEAINEVYDEGQDNILQIEFGPQFARVVELDVGVGFFQELAHKVDANGRASGEVTMLTWWPAMSLDGSLRLHLVDEQLIVPYVRAGFDWVVWSEKWDAGSGKDVIRGDKFGNHMGLGASLLLDPFDRGRASLLEAQTGINDTYLTFEWRRQRIDDRALPWSPAPNRVKGFDFGGTLFTVGLKLDY